MKTDLYINNQITFYIANTVVSEQDFDVVASKYVVKPFLENSIKPLFIDIFNSTIKGRKLILTPLKKLKAYKLALLLKIVRQHNLDLEISTAGKFSISMRNRVDYTVELTKN